MCSKSVLFDPLDFADPVIKVVRVRLLKKAYCSDTSVVGEYLLVQIAP